MTRSFVREPSGDVVDVAKANPLDLSVVCPFYNEERILDTALRGMLRRLRDHLTVSWELVVVDDGSTDRSRGIAEAIARTEPRLRVLHYPFNRGRGHALRTGIRQSRGRILVTTEIDLSWGEDIVERLYRATLEHPDVDIVIASPHARGGGYRNVPWRRVFFSRFGNWVIRRCMSGAATMNTGMTRAYRRSAILTLPLEEDRKEFHLEVVLKAEAMGFKFHEIPALLEWKSYRHEGDSVSRSSSSKVGRLVVTHTLFSIIAKPTRWMLLGGGLCILLSLGFLIGGFVRLSLGLVSVYMLIISLVFAVLALLGFLLGLLTQQGNMIQKEIWKLRSELAELTPEGRHELGVEVARVSTEMQET